MEFGAVATISSSSFTSNIATGGAGCFGAAGAISLEACTLTVTNSSFTTSKALGGTGAPHPMERFPKPTAVPSAPRASPRRW